MQSKRNRYITLSPSCSLRLLETPCVYNRDEDELYEIGDNALEFLAKCDGTRMAGELGAEPEFLSYCLNEGILTSLDSPYKRHFTLRPSPGDVSLRYLELHITSRCNLRCKHCYLSAGDGVDLDLIRVFKVFDEFDKMQGLRMLLSGGEPLMHKGFWYINERIQDFGFRSVLLTNGTLINRDIASRLNVQEAQVSIDGLRVSHDLLRGDGSFNRAIKGIECLTEAGTKVSVATMVTALNRNDFDAMQDLVQALGVSEWNVDIPSLSGRFRENPGLLLPPREAAEYLAYGFGGGHHLLGAEGYACGAHLCAVGSKGQVAKCGFYLDNPVGDVSEGLENCWEKVGQIKLDTLDCDCEHVEDCRGGCRYRAEIYSSEFGPDPVRCYSHGVNPSCMKGGERHDYKEGTEKLRKCV